MRDGSDGFYRTCFYVVDGEDFISARNEVEQRAREQECATGAGEDRFRVRLGHLVDVAPTLQDSAGDAVDLYSRYFASLDTYAEFEIMLGGRDPLAT